MADVLNREKLTKSPSYKQIIFALRMGHKYLVPSLFESAAERVRRQLPSEFTPYSVLGTTDAFRWFTGGDNAFELLTVLREVGLETSVPALCLCYVMEFHAVSVPVSLLSMLSILTICGRRTLRMGGRILGKRPTRTMY